MGTFVFVSNLISHRLHQAWRLTPIVTIMKVARHQSKHWWCTAGGSPIRGSKFGHLGRRGFHLLVILEGELLLKDLCPWFILIHLTNSCPCSKFFRSRSIASSYLGSSLLSHMNRLSEGRDCWFTTDWSAVWLSSDVPHVCSGKSQMKDNGLAGHRRSTIWRTQSQRWKTRSDIKPGTYSCRRESFLLWEGLSCPELQVSAWLHLKLSLVTTINWLAQQEL